MSASSSAPIRIYVDDLYRWAGPYDGPHKAQSARVGARNNHEWCHLIADEADCEELHAFAARLGMKREWFHNGHYNLTRTKRTLAVSLGAVEVDRRQLVEIRRKQRERIGAPR